MKRIKIQNGIEYITDWKDSNYNYLADINFPRNQKIIVNKGVTGCGFTTWCIINNENQIIVSPRVKLIHNKIEQFMGRCFYFDREPDNTGIQKDMMILETEFQEYYNSRILDRRPLKIFVTYDSFTKLADMLEQCHFNINDFRISIDEAHCLIKDVKMKEYNNKNTLSAFLGRLFKYDTLLFISATPLANYLQHIKEFQENAVDYIELEWSNTQQYTNRYIKCKSSLDAFDKIFTRYQTHTDYMGNNVFDAVFYGDNKSVFSYETCIFLNSVSDIVKIIDKYVNKQHLISASDIGVLCARTSEKEILKINKDVTVLKEVPKKGCKHPIWTFITRTCFEGVDFYGDNSSTFVIANYNISSLSLDIASDIVQIQGRERNKKNMFRDRINIYHTNNMYINNDAEFMAFQKTKIDNSNLQIGLYNTTLPQYKNVALYNLNNCIDRYPNNYYLTLANGYPEINNLLMVSEQYCHDILKNHQKWFIVPNNNFMGYSSITNQLKNDLSVTQNKIDIVFYYFNSYPNLHGEFFNMLCHEGFTDIAYYFNALPLDRIHALGCNTTRMNQEINQNRAIPNISAAVGSVFMKGQIYSNKEVKDKLQAIYDSLGIKKTAKATELSKYIGCKTAKLNGIKAIRIL